MHTLSRSKLIAARCAADDPMRPALLKLHVSEDFAEATDGTMWMRVKGGDAAPGEAFIPPRIAKEALADLRRERVDHATVEVNGTAVLTAGSRKVEWQPEPRIYRIIRFRFKGRRRVIRNNVTLTEAQTHCRRDDTHGERAGVRWFDGYDYMPGCAPKEAQP